MISDSSFPLRQAAGEQQHAASENNMNQPLMNDRNAAQLLGLSVSSLRRWRTEGKGPKIVRVGPLVRYRLSDLIAYIEHAVVDPAAEGKADADALTLQEVGE